MQRTVQLTTGMVAAHAAAVQLTTGTVAAHAADRAVNDRDNGRIGYRHCEARTIYPRTLAVNFATVAVSSALTVASWWLCTFK